MIKNGTSRTLIRKVCNSIGMWGPALGLILLVYHNSTNKCWSIILITLASTSRAAGLSGWAVNMLEISPNYAGIVSSIIQTFGAISSFIAPLVWGTIVIDMVNKNLFR